MKIGIFTCEYPPYPGGIATYTREMARALHELGHEPVVHVFVERGQLPDDPFEVQKLPPETYSHAKLPVVALSAAGALHKRQFDMLFAADLQSLLALAWLAPKLPMRAAIHGTDTQSKLLTRIFRPPLSRPLDRFDMLVSNSDFTRELLLRTHGYVQRERTKTAWLGVSDYWRLQDPDGVEVDLGSGADIPPRRLLLVSVGRLEPRKGFDVSIQAVASLPESLRRELTYVIVGRSVDQHYEAKLRTLAQQSGADVRLLGVATSDVIRALYRRADLLLHTAVRHERRVEGFGLVIAEAACSGLPALASRIDALPEVIKDGETGVLVAEGDVEAVRHALATLLSDGDRLRAMKVRCRQLADAFTWARCARTAFDL